MFVCISPFSNAIFNIVYLCLDIYTQEVTNLQTEVESGGVKLSWETTHHRIANESFLLSVYDVSDKVSQVVTTQRLEYSLTHLSLSHTYLLRVQVVNRLNNSHSYTQVSYTHTEVTTSTPINLVVYVVAGLLLFIILLVLTIVVCSVVRVRKVLKRKKTNKYKYSKKSLEDTTIPSDRREYISLSDFHIGQTHNYEPMASVYPSPIGQTHKYEPMASVYPPPREYVPLGLTTSPIYCEIPELNLDQRTIPKNKV